MCLTVHYKGKATVHVKILRSTYTTNLLYSIFITNIIYSKVPKTFIISQLKVFYNIWMENRPNIKS